MGSQPGSGGPGQGSASPSKHLPCPGRGRGDSCFYQRSIEEGEGAFGRNPREIQRSQSWDDRCGQGHRRSRSPYLNPPWPTMPQIFVQACTEGRALMCHFLPAEARGGLRNQCGGKEVKEPGKGLCRVWFVQGWGVGESCYMSPSQHAPALRRAGLAHGRSTRAQTARIGVLCVRSRRAAMRAVGGWGLPPGAMLTAGARPALVSHLGVQGRLHGA